MTKEQFAWIQEMKGSLRNIPGLVQGWLMERAGKTLVARQLAREVGLSPQQMTRIRRDYRAAQLDPDAPAKLRELADLYEQMLSETNAGWEPVTVNRVTKLI